MGHALVLVTESDMMRDSLIHAYLDFINNYLTIEKYADHNEMSVDEATAFMSVAKHVFNNPHPES